MVLRARIIILWNIMFCNLCMRELVSLGETLKCVQREYVPTLLAHSVVNATGQTEAAFRDSERAHVGVAASTNFMCAWGSEPPLDDNTALR